MDRFNNLFNMDVLFNIAIVAVPALICITIHELAHGFTAYKLGDNTAKEQGRLTLNPIKHIDIMGLVMILLFRFGWAKPVPVNMQNFKNPKFGMAITALAGPLSNIILAFIVIFIFVLIFAVLPLPNNFWSMLEVFFHAPEGGIHVVSDLSPGAGVIALIIIYLIFVNMAILNVALAIFNMLPVPPLDGSKILFSFLPERLYYKLMRYERFGMIAIIGLMALGMFTGINIIGNIVMVPAHTFFQSVTSFFTSVVT